MNDLAIPSLFGISAFSGVGMLDEGFRAGLGFLGIPYRTVCHIEREAYAASVLAARMEEGSLAKAPVWPDITTFDAGRWRKKVDCIVAGFPCQDLSVAGKRAGLDGKRSGLFFELLRIANACGAWSMLLENVAGIASATASVVDSEEGELEERAAARVLGELADGGWNAEWLTLSASDVGASHGRARWFCLAWRQLADTPWHERYGGGDGEDRIWRGILETGNALGNTSGDGWRKRWAKLLRQQGRPNLARTGVSMADTGRQGQQRDEFYGSCAYNGRRQETHGSTGELCGLFAPGPNDSRWTDIIRQHPERSPALESDFRCMVDGLAFGMGDSRAARLKCVGNGVVALQSAAATVVLVRRAFYGDS